jgi:hypothetical protein
MGEKLLPIPYSPYLKLPLHLAEIFWYGLQFISKTPRIVKSRLELLRVVYRIQQPEQILLKHSAIRLKSENLLYS